MNTASRAARQRPFATVLVALACIGVAAGCTGSSTGASMTGDAAVVVTVRSADGDSTELEPDGGGFTYTDDCLEAPLTVTYEGGGELTFDAPRCPGQELLVRDGSIQIVEPSLT